MAFDGFTTAAIAYELSEKLGGGYISKIIQPEHDELLLTVKTPAGNFRLLLSANPSLPLANITQENKPAPMTAPNFCMLLRKHLGGGRIASIKQPSLERILVFTIEHRNELGDPCEKRLIIELMGKHSNIIFTDTENTILDAIRRVPGHISSVREVLPGRKYFIPQTTEKLDPFSADEELFTERVFSQPDELARAVYTAVTGFSPAMAEELCIRSVMDGRLSAKECSEAARSHFYHTFSRMIDEVREHEFHPTIYYSSQGPIDFSVLPSERFPAASAKAYDSISELLSDYYSEKESLARIRQKSTDLRRLVSTALERNVKKLNLQKKQLKDTEKMDRYRIWGELLNTYGYVCRPGDKELKAVNYYNNEPVTIPLDPTLSATDNAKKYFDRYGKLKRTAEACTGLIEETSADIEYLESVQSALEIAQDEADLAQIRQELVQSGYIKKHTSGKKNSGMKKSTPLHYLSTDGFDLYVGKNNFQNDELTFSFASGSDWWFHAKKMPGSHVVLKTGGKEPTDKAFEEAASLAAYYSRGKQSDKVEIDYLQRKNIKKPNGAKPGFVIYYTNYSMMARPCIDGLTMV